MQMKTRLRVLSHILQEYLKIRLGHAKSRFSSLKNTATDRHSCFLELVSLLPVAKIATILMELCVKDYQISVSSSSIGHRDITIVP